MPARAMKGFSTMLENLDPETLGHGLQLLLALVGVAVGIIHRGKVDHEKTAEALAHIKPIIGKLAEEHGDKVEDKVVEKVETFRLKGRSVLHKLAGRALSKKSKHKVIEATKLELERLKHLGPR